VSRSAMSLPAGATLRSAESEAPALPALILFFAVLAFVLGLSDRLLQDPDTHWHIAVGERIWRTGALPRVDDMSHTFAGHPWIAKEWLSQLLLYGAYALAGWSGLAFLTAVVVAASFALLFAWLLNRLKATVALAMALVALLLAAGQFIARPHIFFLPLLLAWIGGLIGAAERHSPPPWRLLPLVALWASLHASVTIAFALAAVIAAEAVAVAAAAERRRIALRWIVFGLAALAAAGATPYGYEPLLVTFKVFGGNEAVRYIDEWQPIALDLVGVVALAVLVASLAMLLSAPRANLFRLALVLLCGALMLRHFRFAGLFGLVAAMAMATPLARRFAAVRPQPTQSAASTRAMALAGLAAMIPASVVLAAVARPQPSARMMPAAALSVAEEFGVAGPVFNDYDFGGYLIARGVKTFVDGRSDQLFGDGFMRTLDEAVRSGSDGALQSLLERYRVGWALVRPRSPEAAKLDRLAGWDKLYQDDVAAVYATRR
jgi:hypothetical protein